MTHNTRRKVDRTKHVMKRHRAFRASYHVVPDRIRQRTRQIRFYPLHPPQTKSR